MSRHVLRAALRRHTRLFRPRFGPTRPPSRFDLLRYELAARRGLDLFLAFLLLVPGLGDCLRPLLRRRLVCAFLGFEDDREQRVGCLLHPTRWDGREMRPAAAFALLPGVGCGAPDYHCQAAYWFARAGAEERQRFARQTAYMDWFAYSRAAAAYRPTTRRAGG